MFPIRPARRGRPATRAPADYLAIGTPSHADWQHSPEAGKIQRARDLRGQGFAVAVVSEEHWVGALGAPHHAPIRRVNTPPHEGGEG